MDALGPACLLLAAYLAAETLGARLPPRGRPWPRRVLAVLLAAVGFELARYDHGWGRALFGVVFVGAPLVVIFGAASAGVRRFWGWPDLGPVPGRMAAVAATGLLGVLAGVRIHAVDVEETQRRAEPLRAALVRAHAERGAWPARLEDAVADVPRTRMGSVAPPPFSWDAAKARLSFPLSTRSMLGIDVGTEGATWTRTDR